MSENQGEPKLPPEENSESDELWRQWKQHRRSQTVGRDFVDRVMTAVAAPPEVTYQAEDKLLMRIGNSAWGRFGVCSAAMLVGLVPFLYLAFAAKLLTF